MRDVLKSPKVVGGTLLYERDWLYTSADGLTSREPLFLLINCAAHTSVWGLLGQVNAYNSTGLVRHLSIPDGSGALTAVLGETGTSVSLLSVEKIDITVGADSTWGGSAKVTIAAAGGLHINSNTTIDAGAGVTAAVGGGAFTLALMQGAWSMPSGDGSWAGAADKALSLTASGTGAINIETGTGTINIGNSVGARSVNVATSNSQQTTTVGSIGSGSATTVRGQSGNLTLQASFGSVRICGSSTSRGIACTESSGSEMTLGVFGSTTDIKISSSKLSFFGAAPVARPTVTGALSTVLDANAKAVLQSIIAALVALGAITDGTT